MPKYTVEQKLRGQDLHGLSCRVPEPTPEQAKCSHETTKYEVRKFWNYWDWDRPSFWDSEEEWVTVSTYVDIPGTNNFRCTQCGYTRRY